MSKHNKAVLALASMWGGMTSLQFDPFKDDLEGIDIPKEMDLIRQKKSKLNARLRRVVQYRFNQVTK